MKVKEAAKRLGVAEGATQDEVLAAISERQTKKAKANARPPEPPAPPTGYPRGWLSASEHVRAEGRAPEPIIRFVN